LTVLNLIFHLEQNVQEVSSSTWYVHIRLLLYTRYPIVTHVHCSCICIKGKETFIPENALVIWVCDVKI
jgi:hypothetical protein